MLRILRLEYLFNRRQVLIVLAIFTAYFAYIAGRIESPRLFIVMTSLMVGLAMPFTILGREDKFKTASLVCSLPVRRSTVVLGKYASTWMAIGLGLAYALLLTAVLPFSKISVSEVLGPKTLLISLFLMSLVFAVILPFTLRFGLSGIIILLVGTQLLGIVALFMTQLGGGAKNPLRTVIRAVEGGLRALLGHDPTAGFLLTLLAAVVVINAASIVIGQALYARRDL
ncbi:MAG: ABC-2 transporter permease [Candidatus Aminicenantes bacterium]|nr:ABC-2 transporter permease [Candidatus Aminicenantes bacterium]